MQKIQRSYLIWLILAGLIVLTFGLTPAGAEKGLLDRSWGDYTFGTYGGNREASRLGREDIVARENYRARRHHGRIGEKTQVRGRSVQCLDLSTNPEKRVSTGGRIGTRLRRSHAIKKLFRGVVSSITLAGLNDRAKPIGATTGGVAGGSVSYACQSWTLRKPRSARLLNLAAPRGRARRWSRPRRVGLAAAAATAGDSSREDRRRQDCCFHFQPTQKRTSKREEAYFGSIRGLSCAWSSSL